MSNASANEQLMIELINRARLDPSSEAARYGISLNQGISGSGITAAAKQPLAMNDALINSSRSHSKWMLDADVFSHTGAGGSNAGSRMSAAGYEFAGSWSWGENISWRGTTGTPNLTSYVYEQHKSLFLSPGHRLNILNVDFREAGIGQVAGVFTSGGRNYNASMITENFAKSGTKFFALGVAYNDLNGDKFYSVGEARSGVQMTLQLATGGSSLVTKGGAAGGYELGVDAGKYNITFSGAGLPSAMTVQATIAKNVKLDVVNGNEIHSSTSLDFGSGALNAVLLGVDPLNLTGNGLNNALKGNASANVINGAAGNDQIEGGGGNDTLTPGSGGDTVYGGAGDDLFIFARGHGTDRIMDFTAGGTTDEVRLIGLAGVTTFAALMSHAKDYAGFMQFEFGNGDILRLDGVKAADLTAGDFIFG